MANLNIIQDGHDKICIFVIVLKTSLWLDILLLVIEHLNVTPLPTCHTHLSRCTQTF